MGAPRLRASGQHSLCRQSCKVVCKIEQKDDYTDAPCIEKIERVQRLARLSRQHCSIEAKGMVLLGSRQFTVLPSLIRFYHNQQHVPKRASSKRAATTARAPGLSFPGVGNLDSIGRLGSIGFVDDSISIKELRVRDVKVVQPEMH